jgi:membrane-bound acyltransferase YfiQ involved in biofilm formation
MGVFSGIEILFFLLGAFTILSINALLYFKKRYAFKWYSTLIAAGGIFLGLFTIAWAVSSIIEGEPRSAGMGILIFGVSTLICFAITRQIALKDHAK